MYVSAIIAAGGRGARFGGDRPKQLLLLGGRPLLQHSVETFLRSSRIDDIVIALPPDTAAEPPDYLSGDGRLRVVAGGSRRQDSVANGFMLAAERADVIVIHDGARPFVTEELIARTIDAAVEVGAAIAALSVRDTVKQASADRIITATLPRSEIYLAQTPQAFRVGVLRDALASATDADEATDEAMLAERAGHAVRLVEGDPRNIKITTPDDLSLAELLLRPGGGIAAPSGVAGIRIGNGYDLHRLVAGRPLILGGVTIPFERGLQGHSDADALCHAVTDAILGAAGAGDIGRHFPDDEPVWKDANSLELLRRAAGIVREAGFSIANVDVIVVAERPKLLPFLPAMCANVAGALGVSAGSVSIKGKTNEGIDSVGRGESIAVHAVALISKATDHNWRVDT